jgi:hypothetical protein
MKDRNAAARTKTPQTSQLHILGREKEKETNFIKGGQVGKAVFN